MNERGGGIIPSPDSFGAPTPAKRDGFYTKKKKIVDFKRIY